MSILEVNNIKKVFDKHTVLKDISFSLEQGEVLSIIGSSGSGKTTLLRCLNFLETANEGIIKVNGKNVFEGGKKTDSKTLNENRANFGLVFQNFNLFPQYTVFENICLAPKMLKKDTNERIEELANELIAKVGLSDRANYYPCQLSGGQQQRVAIARALALKPQILCFDEPTSALDPELTGEVLKVIRSLKESAMTMIVVTHEMQFAHDVSDKVMFMADGIIEEMGTPAEVFDNPKSARLQAFLSNTNI